MKSAYFKLKTQTDEFKENIENIIEKVKDKKVLFYGIENFGELNKVYDFINKLNITVFVDEKQESEKTSVFYSKKTISKDEISKEDFDVVIISNENPQEAINHFDKIGIKEENILKLFVEDVKEEEANINFLYKNKFDKTLPKLVKKMKNKKVLLYGAGIYLEVIKKYFDLSELNIIGIADKKYLKDSKEEFLGYKTYSPEEIKDLNPDFVLISTKYYINIFEYLYYDLLKNYKIKVKPLVKKSFFTLLKEI